MKQAQVSVITSDDFFLAMSIDVVEGKGEYAQVIIEYNDDDVTIKTRNIGALKAELTPTQIVGALCAELEAIQAKHSLESMRDAFDYDVVVINI